MSVSERQRRELFTKLESAIGADAADSLMHLLPRIPNNELATRADLLALASELRGEMAEIRGEMAEMRGEMAEIRGEMAEMRGNLQRWMAGVMAANATAVVAALAA